MLGLELPAGVSVYSSNPLDGPLLAAVIGGGSGINSEMSGRGTGAPST